MRYRSINKIELIPKNNGPVIAGAWDNGNILYLVGLGGACRWSIACDGGALPLAVAIQNGNGATIAPVHPLCRVDMNPTTIRLGSETFDVKIIQSVWRRYVNLALACIVIATAFIGGWCLRIQISSASPTTAQVMEDVYVF